MFRSLKQYLQVSKLLILHLELSELYVLISLTGPRRCLMETVGVTSGAVTTGTGTTTGFTIATGIAPVTGVTYSKINNLIDR